jgi:hypothetical protein
MQKLVLPTVTLCAAASVNVNATIDALITCLQQVDFAECLLFTDADVGNFDPSVRVVRIDRLRSASEYSFFVLKALHEYIETQHCLLVQWDGFVTNANAWSPDFLAFDYIGAPWPQFPDGRNVGNGGFSLRSRKLLKACAAGGFWASHPEDLAICHSNRSFLESEFDIRFADVALAKLFAFERTPPSTPTFGFHGIFNMIPIHGRDQFWALYRTLDDRGTVRPDYGLMMRQLGVGPTALVRQFRLTTDMMKLMLRPSGFGADQAT